MRCLLLFLSAMLCTRALVHSYPFDPLTEQHFEDNLRSLKEQVKIPEIQEAVTIYLETDQKRYTLPQKVGVFSNFVHEALLTINHFVQTNPLYDAFEEAGRHPIALLEEDPESDKASHAALAFLQSQPGWQTLPEHIKRGVANPHSDAFKELRFFKIPEDPKNTAKNLRSWQAYLKTLAQKQFDQRQREFMDFTEQVQSSFQSPQDMVDATPKLTDTLADFMAITEYIGQQNLELDTMLVELNIHLEIFCSHYKEFQNFLICHEASSQTLNHST